MPKSANPPTATVTPRPPRNRTAVTILRRPQVEDECGYARSTIYLRITQGLWPRPISLGARAVGWPASEVAAMNAARISGKSEAQIRSLVTALEAARATADTPSTASEE